MQEPAVPLQLPQQQQLQPRLPQLRQPQHQPHHQRQLRLNINSYCNETDGTTVDLTINNDSNITNSQISNPTLTTDQSIAKTIISFTITGTSGTVGFANMTVPISSVPYGTTPIVYIDGVQAANQGYTQDANNYYVWYTTHFSTHQIQIQFTGQTETATPSSTAQPTLNPIGP